MTGAIGTSVPRGHVKEFPANAARWAKANYDRQFHQGLTGGPLTMGRLKAEWGQKIVVEAWRGRQGRGGECNLRTGMLTHSPQTPLTAVLVTCRVLSSPSRNGEGLGTLINLLFRDKEYRRDREGTRCGGAGRGFGFAVEGAEKCCSQGHIHEDPRGYASYFAGWFYNYGGNLLPHFLLPNMSSSPPLDCGSGGGDTAFKGLRIASLFIIWASSSFAATFPIVAHRSRVINLPLAVFESVFSSLTSLPTWFSYQLPTGRPNILGLGLSSPLDSSTSSPPASASSPHPVLEPHGKAMFAPLSDGNLSDNNSDWRMQRSPTPWPLLSCRLLAYL
jgi:hypothetical protein